ncbi:conserved hypothetical protein [Ricinus communis]|uniref:Uncharacterized protein n=1 Tax=Ricinus communis TaxID=3988 RepID=B9RLI2_RICCO|nr:conserved hypothetical protein [Ricinus communis]
MEKKNVYERGEEEEESKGREEDGLGSNHPHDRWGELWWGPKTARMPPLQPTGPKEMSPMLVALDGDIH